MQSLSKIKWHSPTHGRGLVMFFVFLTFIQTTIFLLIIFYPFMLFSQIDDTVRVDNGTGRGKAPSITLDDGNIYVAWMDSRNDTNYVGNWDVYFAKSTDSGETFSENVWVGKCFWGEEIPPGIAIDNRGDIYITFSDIGTHWEDFDVYLAKSTNGGASFQPRVRIDHGSDSYAHTYGRPIAVDDSDRVYIVWYDDRNYPGSKVFFNKSVDGGETFMDNDITVDVGNNSYDAFPSSLALDSNGNIFVSWSMHTEPHHLYLSKSNDGGESFDSSHVQVDDNQYTYEMVYRPCLIIDAMDNIYIVWRNTDNIPATNDGYIYFKKSSDGGVTFSPRIRIDTPDTTEGLSRYPRMAVDKSQNVFITWSDYRRGHVDVYFNMSFDSGLSFGNNQSLIETSHSTHRPDIAVDDSSIVYLVWSEKRESSENYKIYFTKFKPLPTKVDENRRNVSYHPGDISLLQNYPNPFNFETRIEYSIKGNKKRTSLTIYNLPGEKVRTLIEKELHSGNYSVVWDGKDDAQKSLSSGVYFCRLKAGSSIKVHKIILLK